MQSTQEGQDKECKKVQGSMKVMAIIAVKGQMLDDFGSQLPYGIEPSTSPRNLAKRYDYLPEIYGDPMTLFRPTAFLCDVSHNI
jgi:hypothetical protein